MLSAEENELLTRVGPGTPVGDLIRQYWIPALMSSELSAPDGPPLRIRLLGENLIAFRSTSGKVGLMAHACPHRGASLFFGRNEAEGIRCVYHGWKFDVAGQCLEMPSEPPDSNFKDKVRARAYPCWERNCIIFASIGPRQNPPPLPDLEPNLLSDGQTEIWTTLRECNWVQAMEGDIDTAHLGLLHLGGVSPDDVGPGTFDYYTVKDRAPKYKVVDTEWGTMYGAYRPAAEETYYWRIAQFLFPFYTLIPTGVLGVQVLVRAWVPLDDHHTIPLERGVQHEWATIRWHYGATAVPAQHHGLARAVAAGGQRLQRFPDRPRGLTHPSYTGIDGIHLQDQAITESMGAIADRAQEHLGTSDAMIIRTRRRLMKAASDLLQGNIPPTVDHPELYRQRSGGVMLPRSADWVEATEELRTAFVQHPEPVPLG